jgi:high-affinity Fe2+/Pb2+ permease
MAANVDRVWLSLGETLGAEMEGFSALAMALAMVAAFLLLIGGAKLVLARQTRFRGVLMLVAAAVLVMNVMIWTV